MTIVIVWACTIAVPHTVYGTEIAKKTAIEEAAREEAVCKATTYERTIRKNTTYERASHEDTIYERIAREEWRNIESEQDAQPNTQTDTQPDVQLDAQTYAQPDVQTDAQPDVQSDAQTNTQPDAQQDTQGIVQSAEESLLESLQLDELQEDLDALLGADSPSAQDMIKNLINGENVIDIREIKSRIIKVVQGQIDEKKDSFLRLLLLVLAAALFSCFSQIFAESQIGEMSFYMIYLLLFALVVSGFGEYSTLVAAQTSGLTAFMKAAAPAYYLAIAAANGASTAALFYQLLLLAILLADSLLLTLLLPLVHVYLLLSLVNQLTREDFLSRLAELVKSVISWSLKSLLTLIVGLQLIQSLVTPAVDALRRTAIGKTAGMIPGLGNALSGVTELVIGSAVLIRNCLGTVVLVVLLLAGIGPLLRLSVSALLYRLLAAVTQPISDERIAGCLSAAGESCGLLLRILFTAQIMFLLSIAIMSITLK